MSTDPTMQVTPDIDVDAIPETAVMPLEEVDPAIMQPELDMGMVPNDKVFDDTSLVEGTPDGEPVQVAGLGGMIGKISKVVSDPEAPRMDPPDAAVMDTGQRLVITEADQVTARRFKEVFNLPENYRVPIYKPNLGSMGKGLGNRPGEAPATLDDVALGYADALSIIYEENIAKASRGKMTIDEIVASAQEDGLDEAFLTTMARRVGDDVGPESMAKALWVFQNTMAALDDSMAKGDTEEILRMLPIAARITINTSSMATETGRTFSVLSHAARSGALADVERASALPELLEKYGVKEETVQDLRAAYITLPKAGQRNAMTHGVMQKGLNVWAEMYINALLSSPVTHMVNIVSNALFGFFQLPERALGGVIGGVRTNVFRGMTSSDRVYMEESFAMVQSLRLGMRDALIASSRALKNEQETFGAMTKLDVQERRAISADYLDIDREKLPFVAKAVDAAGIFTRLLGSRLLLAEDEAAKGLAFQAELYAQAVRRTKAAIHEGMDPEEAAETVGAKILMGRDATATRTSQEMAQRLTFQQDLGPFAGKLQGLMAHPLAKILVPFFKTPTNIVKETLSRTPLAFLPGTGFWSDVTAGGARADMAMSRFALGSTIFATFAYAAAGSEGSSVMLTGSGPTDDGAKAAWRRMKLQPHSIAVLNEDGKTYTSYDYSRMAPIAGILSMAADYAAYSQYEEDASTLEKLFIGGGTALYDQMKNLPMLQGMFDIAEIIGSEHRGSKDTLKATLEKLTEQITAAGLTSLPLTPSGGITATVERVGDPLASNTMDATSDFVLRGFYKALNKAKSRNPFFSQDVPRKLNLWGEEMKSCENGLWCFISPIRVIDSKYNAVDAELVRLGLGIPMPQRVQRGVRLSADEYNRLILEMNLIDDGDGNNMLEELADTIENDELYADAPIGHDEENKLKGKIDILRSIKNRRLGEALDTIINESPDLAAKARLAAASRARSGKRETQ